MDIVVKLLKNWRGMVKGDIILVNQQQYQDLIDKDIAFASDISPKFAKRIIVNNEPKVSKKKKKDKE